MTLNDAYKLFGGASKEALDRLRENVARLRTGRVTSAMIEGIPVEHYGAHTPLNGIGSISMADARTLVISPWDPSALAPIKKALTEADLGAQPVDDGKVVRLVFASLTEENRHRSLKVLNEHAEEARVRLRQARDEALRMIKESKQKGELTEDDFYGGKDKLDSLIDEANKEILEISRRKEAEIATV